ncbi:MAG TPA: bifunctional pyr operon transcriptional regulator/uracil phosphoribosyltransferase PyrR [Burkholderiales bacterium]|nr:bifunctional pyr operon transcriptional regulator/uracil phosphoribosyltransferase PyrR [Burkholderiales bacterium]
MIQLPDAERLVTALIDQMRPQVSSAAGLVGIRTGGVWIAERLHTALRCTVPPAALDVSFYRDDFDAEGLKHAVQSSHIPFEVEGRDLILVDDVLYTGRTIRAAMNELFDYGRPRSIRLAALIDRGGRELPIAAQFLGATLEVPARYSVDLEQENGRLRFALREKK